MNNSNSIKRYLYIFLISITAQIPLTSLRFVIPIFAQQHGATIFDIGLLGTVYGLVYFISALIFGKISEKFGIKKISALGMILYMFISLIYLLFKSPYEYILGKAFEGISMAMVWPAVEGLSSKLGGKNKETALLMYTFAWSVGASIAPYASAYLLTLGNFYPLVFASLISFISASFITISKPEEAGEFIPSPGEFSIIYNIILPMLLYGFDSSIFYSFYSVYGIVFSYGKQGSGLLGTFYGVTQTLSFILNWYISKKVSSLKLSILGIVMSLPVFFILIDHTFIVSLTVFSILGFGMGFVYFSALISIFRSFHKDVTSKTGIFESSIGLGYVVGPFISGIPTKLGYLFPWLIIGSFSLIILIMELIGLMKKRKVS